MRFQCRIESAVPGMRPVARARPAHPQRAPAAQPPTEARSSSATGGKSMPAGSKPPTRSRLRARGSLPVRGAIAAAVVIAAAGCAALDSQVAKAWTVEPVFNVKHTIESSQAYYTMGRYFDGSREWDKAIAAYRKAIAADAQNIEAYNALGVALAQSGGYANAETTLRQAVALAPELAHVRSNLGYVLLLAGKPSEAVLELKAAVKQDGGSVTALANLRDAQAQSDAAQYGAAAASSEPTTMAPLASEFANSSAALVVTDTVSADFGGGTISLELPTTVSVPTPITTAVAPAPLAVPVSTPVPLQTASLPTPQRIAAAPAQESATGVDTVPLALLVSDRANVASLQEAAAAVASTAPATPPGVDVPPASRVAPIVARRSGSATQTSRLEVSNGNGITGMAARVGHWLAQQGVRTDRLTNQKPFVQRWTVIQYRDGHEQEAQRIARSLPAHATAVMPKQHLGRSDVRVVLGRDWAPTAACLERNTCQPVAVAVAAADSR